MSDMALHRGLFDARTHIRAERHADGNTIHVWLTDIYTRIQTVGEIAAWSGLGLMLDQHFADVQARVRMPA